MPKVAVIAALSVLLSGAVAIGVRDTICVVDWPTASVTLPRPLIPSPFDAEDDRLTVSDTLPTFVNISVTPTATPGVVLTAAGSPAIVTASIAGTVKVTIWNLVIAGLVALVA